MKRNRTLRVWDGVSLHVLPTWTLQNGTWAQVWLADAVTLLHLATGETRTYVASGPLEVMESTGVADAVGTELIEGDLVAHGEGVYLLGWDEDALRYALFDWPEGAAQHPAHPRHPLTRALGPELLWVGTRFDE